MLLQQPQIVIVKNQLASGSGLGLILQVKSSLPDTKIIMITDVDDLKSKKSAMKLGLDRFCYKEHRFELVDIVADLVDRL